MEIKTIQIDGLKEIDAPRAVLRDPDDVANEYELELTAIRMGTDNQILIFKLKK